ncbi:MAG: hypothetical protein HKN02_07765, partial [Rhodobacteraceae bacterium]|nr:hypothetical protein [Paracoccaceae bacterium]
GNGAPFPPDGSDYDVSYLVPATRALLFDAALSDPFKVSRSGDKAIVELAGKQLITIQKPDEAKLEQQLAHLRTYADLRGDRVAEIQVQTDDILSFFSAITYLDEKRRGHTLELLNATVRLAIHVEMQIKHYCRTRRPQALSNQVQPMIQTPDHSAFPSGHATEAFAVATVLYLLREDGAGTYANATSGLGGHSDPLYRAAHRIATNRTVAGVHYPCDSAAGAMLGLALGTAVRDMGRATSAGGLASPLSFGFTSTASQTAKFNYADDFDIDWLAARAAPLDGTRLVAKSPMINQLWSLAKAEWAG